MGRNHNRTVLGGLMAAAFMAAAIYAGGPAGCGGDGDGGGNFACSFEESKTDGCDGMGFGPFEADCFSFNSDDYNITPQEVCANVTEEGLFCQAGCCIDYEYQNVELNEGFCN